MGAVVELREGTQVEEAERPPLLAQPAQQLVLHFDVNETIMLGDPAGGDTFEDSLHKDVMETLKNRFPKKAQDKGSVTMSQVESRL